MKFLILNGPNLNLMRWSEPGVPGELDYNAIMDYVQAGCEQLGIETDCCQSNHEGDLVDEIQAAAGRVDGIVLNPGAYAHYSVAMMNGDVSINQRNRIVTAFMLIITAVAVVVTNDGADMTLEELEPHLNDHLARYKHPKDLVLVPELPRNASGKIVKPSLRSSYGSKDAGLAGHAV